jgi:hypothetical protein
MVDTTAGLRKEPLEQVAALVRVYVVITILTVGGLVVLSIRGSDLATQEAWIHAVIVVVFAVLLSMRLRSARHGSDDAWRAIGVIGAVLFAVNVVESLIPGLFPVWMRVEMIGIAVLMALIAVLVRRAARPQSSGQAG